MKTPLTVHEYSAFRDIRDADGTLLIELTTQSAWQEAHRIVASINACAHIALEALELTSGDWFLKLIRERDALRAALEPLVGYMDDIKHDAEGLPELVSAAKAALGETP